MDTSSPSGRRSLFGSVPVAGSRLKRFFAFLGPGYLVATGYMDPGNWATALAAGSRFGMALLYVAVLSSVMAMALQALAARLAIATGYDLATLCRREFRRPAPFLLWLVSQGAVIATDLAEVIGTAIGFSLLFELPLWIGVALTALDVWLALLLERVGFRKLEAAIFALVMAIVAAFAVQLGYARPDGAEMLAGLVPSDQLLMDKEMLYLAIGVIGATVMPHNLFLHTGVLLTRKIGDDLASRKEAVLFSTLDSTIALIVAMAVNASILILAAATFHRAGQHDVAELGQAYALIAPLLGSAFAAKLFAVALIACGLNSTVTATLAGQIVTSGFLDVKLSATTMRMATRALSIVPALAVTLLMGEHATARLLVLSQVVLSIALPFAMVPLVWFSWSKRIMGPLRAGPVMLVAAAAIAALLIGLNLRLLWQAVFE